MTPSSPESRGNEPADQRTFALVRRFWRDFLRQHRAKFFAVAGLMVLTVLLQLPTPLLTMFIIDSAVQGKDFDVITQLALVFLGLIVVRHVASFLNENLTLKLKETIILDLASYLVRHLQKLPLAFFSRHHSTYLQSRLMNDSRAIEGALIRSVVNLVTNGLTFVVGATFVLVIRWDLGLFLLATVLPFAFIRYYANDRMRVLSGEMQERQAVASAKVAESLAAIRTVKAFRREELQAAAVATRLRDLKDIYVRTNFFGIISTIGTSFVMSVAIAFVLWYGLRAVAAGQMSIGEVVGILSFLNFLYGPVNVVVAANLSMQQSAAALQRVYEFLVEEPEDQGGSESCTSVSRVDFENVRFGYAVDEPVLHGVSFSVRAGETIALVGKSGAGKSTLVHLLLRFYEPGSGRITIDGNDIGSYSLASLRSAIGLVDQETFLFNDSIRENVRFGRPEATDEEIEEACAWSHAAEFINALPQGLDSEVGERGVRLSGGQCQRIALARVFLENPRILILDEAVSSVDSESEEAIHQALERLASDRATIVIAHRLTSLLLADRVVMIDDGRVIEQGTHEELLAADRAYARLFRSQFEPQLSRVSPTLEKAEPSTRLRRVL